MRLQRILYVDMRSLAFGAWFDMERLLGHAQFIRRELLFIDNAYIRDRQVFAPDSLLSPPTWVQGVPLVIEPLD